MLPCPACNNMIAPDRPRKWFQCPKCDCWLRLQVNSKTSTTWLEPGIHANGNITPIQILQANPAPAVSNETLGQTITSEQSIPVEEMSLEMIRSQRQDILTQLDEIETEMKKLAGVISADRDNTITLRRTNERINRLSEKEKTLKMRERNLQKREKALELETENNAANSSNNNPMWAIGCSTILVAGALVIFGRSIGIQWSSMSVLYLLGIALAGGFLTWFGNYILR